MTRATSSAALVIVLAWSTTALANDLSEIAVASAKLHFVAVGIIVDVLAGRLHA